MSRLAEPYKTTTMVTLVLLSTYILLKRMAMSDGFAFSDWLSLIMSQTQQCTLAFDNWLPPVTCLNVFLRIFVFPYPLMYLAATFLLKLGMLCALFGIVYFCSPKKLPAAYKSSVAIFSVVFIVVAGGGRFLIGGTDLIITSNIYNGMWAHFFVLVALAILMRGQVVLSGAIIAATVFLHPANVFHVFIVLVGAISLQCVFDNNIGRARSLLILAVLGVSAFGVQYVAAYGMPSASFLDVVFWSVEDESVGEIVSKATALSANTRTDAWYEYILSQDPDDLSTIWLLSTKLGAFYLSFIAFGIIIAVRVEKTLSIRILMQRLPFMIVVVSLVYIGVCGLIEYFHVPRLIFEQLIVVQPRRVFFLPVIFLSYYVVRYILDFFRVSGTTTPRRFIVIAVFCTWFFGGLVATTGPINISVTKVMGLYAMCLGLTSVYFVAHRFGLLPRFTNLVSRQRSWTFVAILLVMLKMLPFANATAFKNIDKMFFDLKPRSLIDYVVINAELNSDYSSKNYLEFTKWVRENISRGSSFVSAGFSEIEVMQWGYFVPNRGITSLDPYHYRGGMHYSLENYEKFIVWFEANLKTTRNKLGSENGQTTSLEALIKRLDERDFLNMTVLSNEGEYFDYLMTRYDLDLNLPIEFARDGIVVYRLDGSQ